MVSSSVEGPRGAPRIGGTRATPAARRAARRAGPTRAAQWRAACGSISKRSESRAHGPRAHRRKAPTFLTKNARSPKAHIASGATAARQGRPAQSGKTATLSRPEAAASGSRPSCGRRSPTVMRLMPAGERDARRLLPRRSSVVLGLAFYASSSGSWAGVASGPGARCRHRAPLIVGWGLLAHAL